MQSLNNTVRLLLLFLMLALAGGIADAQVEFLEQNWSPEIRRAYYTTSQGSRIMPYDWFVALEVSDGQESFADVRLRELGYLPNEDTEGNPDKLPVGFVIDENQLTQETFVGLNCAACHTSQIRFEEKTFQIDGGASLADMFGMINGIDQSLKATRNDPDKFKRFATKVLGASANDRIATNKLKRDLNEFLLGWSQFVEDSRVKHPWGKGRLDAFGMIFNRVSSIDLGIPENSQKPDAPVSYPSLWGASFQDRVQWNGSAENANDIERLGRNVGEALGVFAQAQFRSSRIFEIPRPARTSVKRLNQVTLENHLKTLWSPVWPDDFGELDPQRLEDGKQLYADNCMRCHEIVPHGLQNTPVEVSMTLLSEVQTDPRMAMNSAVGTVSAGDLKNLFGGRARVPRGEMLKKLVRLALISPYRDVSTESLLARLETDDVFSAEEIQAFLREIGIGKREALALVEANQDKLQSYYKNLRQMVKSTEPAAAAAMPAAQAPPALKYKAAPLSGIWATAPYLHNGSVPNLYELLSPVKERSPTFFVGSNIFDPKKVGFETTESEGDFLFDTSQPGNSNAGHDMYGTFTEEQRWALVEYLKSL